MRRQTNVVGVVSILVLAVVALGGLTAGVGVLLQSGATTTGAEQTAATFGSAIMPAETVGTTVSDIPVENGTLYSTQRHVRIINGDQASFEPGTQTVTIVEQIRTDGLVYKTETQTVVVHGGAVLYATDGRPRVYRPPPIMADTESRIIRVGVSQRQLSEFQRSVTGSETIRIQTTVTHRRQSFGNGSYYIAIETDYPQVWARQLRERGGTIVATRVRFEGDHADSVVVQFPNTTELRVTRHAMDIEVSAG